MSKVLYPLAAGPKPTQLVGAYTPGDDTIILVDVSHLPPAPNLITISHDENFVTLKYDSIDDENTISGITYIEGDNTYVFPELSLALRTINKYDFDAIRENIVADVTEVIEHIVDYDNPHRVSKEQIGLGNVDNTADVDKPISTAIRAALDDIIDELTGHIDDVSNPHDVTKTQVGLGNVDDTSDVDKPISTATQDALDNKADLINGIVPDSQLPVYSTLELGTTADTAYYGDKGQAAYLHSQITDGNPHGVTKADVGLGDVDNTSDADKPVSTAQQEAIDSVSGEIDTHVADTSNPHIVTKAQVGLANVDNTSDVDKPISSATQAALDDISGDLTSHEDNVSNPHSVTKAQVGLSNVDNTSDIDKPVSTAQATAIGVVQGSIDNHKADKSNPHEVTKTQVGLGSVDNTADIDKPVSTAQATAIGVVQTNLDDHEADTSNPHSVTKTQVGLGNVDNTSDLNKPVSTATQAALDDKADLVNGKVPSSQLPEISTLELGTTATTAYYGDKGKTAYDHSQLTSGNPHQVTKADVGLSNVDNTSDANKPISTATQTALNNKADLVDGVVPSSQLPEISTLELGTTATTAYYGDKGKTAYDHSQLTSGNPHNVTKAEVGLGNVDNTSDANKPVSTAQASAIGVVQTNLDNHEDDTSNPHGVTKAQVGLANVDNTSDLNKPVSTAQQTAIDAVQDNLDSHETDTSNPHNVTKTQVGLGNVNNTSDEDKPVSTLQRAAIDGVQSNLTTHVNNTSNPHSVTKAQVGLANVDNTSDIDKPISSATQSALDDKLDANLTNADTVLVTNSTGDVVTESQESAFNRAYSDTIASPPTISGSAGSGTTTPRNDHQHPSETFTITNITISTGSWIDDSTYVLYPYRATITNSSITASHTPIVVYSQADSSLGIFSQVAETGPGELYLYSSMIPTANTVIDTIVLIKEI